MQVGPAELGIVLVIVMGPIFTYWAARDVWRRRHELQRAGQLAGVWLVVVVAVPFIGPLTYLAIGRRQLVGDSSTLDP